MTTWSVENVVRMEFKGEFDDSLLPWNRRDDGTIRAFLEWMQAESIETVGGSSVGRGHLVVYLQPDDAYRAADFLLDREESKESA